ncbi:MAG: long-chain fatty acid transporter [Ferrovum sp.]|nr:long-chain fatty acid transporter [Ferrovum sp.]NDU87135.1 long-chain fatty acid transporter [Ferrovum sp.]
MIHRKSWLAVLAVGCLVTPLAHATNGYFAIGYGEKSVGMGGVGIALPQDALAAAANPAGMVWVGDRTDIGMEWFRPNRDSTITGNGAGANGYYDGNSSQNFFIPDFGYNRMVTNDSSVGVSIFGNGGMNTNYGSNPFQSFSRTGQLGNAGINMAQLFVSPTFSTKLNATNSVGISLNLAYQTFNDNGLQPFAGISSSAGNLTNNGTDSSTGYGLRIGWTGQMSSQLTLGATYQTKTWMGSFNNYSGLFANSGSFDIPANYGVGMAFKATQTTTVAMDVERILYSGVSSVSNPLYFPPSASQLLGAGNGTGFGWSDINVIKLGVSHVMNSKLTLRAGFNYNTQPIAANQTFFNILAPGIVQNHATLGATYILPNKAELTVSYMHAFANNVNGSTSIPTGFGGGNANLSMREDELGVSYGF